MCAIILPWISFLLRGWRVFSCVFVFIFFSAQSVFALFLFSSVFSFVVVVCGAVRLLRIVHVCLVLFLCVVFLVVFVALFRVCCYVCDVVLSFVCLFKYFVLLNVFFCVVLCWSFIGHAFFVCVHFSFLFHV